MVAWDIDAAQAMGVVARAAGSAQSYEHDVKAAEDAVVGLAGALPHSELVSTAVGDYAQNVMAGHLQEVLGHTSSAVQGTSEAVKAYAEGQLQMAATAQHHAAAATYPGDVPGAGGSSSASGGRPPHPGMR